VQLYFQSWIWWQILNQKPDLLFAFNSKHSPISRSFGDTDSLTDKQYRPLLYTGWPKKLHISICLTLNWYRFAKSRLNFIIFGWEEDILNIACKLISTILCVWHYLVVCQHNSWANFISRQPRKSKILFLQGSVGTCNRCCGQYMHCFVGNLLRCKSADNYLQLSCWTLFLSCGK